MANSFIAAMQRSYTFMVNNVNVTSDLISAFPELKAHYGENVVCEIGVEVQDAKLGNALKFDKTRGIVYGESTLTELQVMCKADVTKQAELAFKLTSDLKFVVNATFNNFAIRSQIIESSVANTVLSVDNIGLATYNFDEALAPTLSTFE